MAVQSQFPTYILLPDSSQYRVRQESGANENRNIISQSTPIVPNTLPDLHLQPMEANLLRAYNSGLNIGPQAVLNGGAILSEPESDVVQNLRKRPRDKEHSITRPRAFIPAVDFQQVATPSPAMIPQAVAPISTGLRLSLEDNRLNPSATCSSGRSGAAHISSTLTEVLQSQMIKQKDEIDQFIRIQGERMKQVLEEKRQKHVRALLVAAENEVTKRLKDKEAELEKVNHRNLELGERVKQLSLETQFWQNIARNNELMVSNLRNSLEQVVAQSREQSKEGCGESEVDDAESCHYGEEGGGGVHILARTFRENKELKQQRTCRVCLANEACILLLPCRHLCMCKDCEGRLDSCPVCSSTKTATVQVYMA
eukprot:c27997_g1_i1 orf=1032-2138(+)